jgi:hypothetical protein
MRHWVVGALFCMSLTATVVDRLAVAVGYTAITELQIDEDVRVAALLNEQSISYDIETRRAAADRLVDQLLIQHEIQISRYPAPSDDEVNAYYAGVEQTLGGAERLKVLLKKYELSQQILRMHLRNQLLSLRFIGFRFRPNVDISDPEIEAAYRRQLNAVDVAGQNPKPDASQRARLMQLLMDDRTDAAMNSWLAESRKQVNISYIDSSLR